jgi:hypothetical protein
MGTAFCLEFRYDAGNWHHRDGTCNSDAPSAKSTWACQPTGRFAPFRGSPTGGSNVTTAHQVYEQAIRPLSAEEKLAIARLIMENVVPNTAVEPGTKHSELVATAPRQFGAGRHLLSGAGIDVNKLLAVPIDDMFAGYMPIDMEESER